MGLRLPEVIYVDEEIFEQSKQDYSRDSSHFPGAENHQ